MPSILGANTLSGGYDVANSLRFNDGSSDYLNRTCGAGSRQTWTLSMWVKRGTLGTDQSLFSTYVHANDEFKINFYDTDRVGMRFYNGSEFQLESNRLFRDTSAWYHLVFVADTTNGTEGNRFRIYVNGTEETSFAAEDQPSQNLQMSINDSNVQQIGRKQTSAYFDGYMAEVVFIDGSALTAASFGEFDEDSPTIWKPINVSGLTFGTNGFHLDFEDSSSLGNDVAGSNNFSVNNLTAGDQSTDTCTNNFCTLSPLYNVDGSYTLSEGNTEFLGTGGNDHTLGTLGVQGSGKWYFEAEFDTNSAAAYAGFADSDLANNLAPDAAGVTVFIGMYRDDHTMQIGGGNEGAYTDVSDGDIFGFAMNLDANSGSKTVIVQKNGSTIDTVTIPTANEDNIFIPIVGDTSGTDARLKLNCGGMPNPTPSSGVADAKGHGSFEYSPTISSVDYLAICTKNIAEFG